MDLTSFGFIINLSILGIAYGSCPELLHSYNDNFIRIYNVTELDFIVQSNQDFKKILNQTKIEFETIFYDKKQQVIFKKKGSDLNLSIKNLKDFCDLLLDPFDQDSINDEEICNLESAQEEYGCNLVIYTYVDKEINSKDQFIFNISESKNKFKIELNFIRNVFRFGLFKENGEDLNKYMEIFPIEKTDHISSNHPTINLKALKKLTCMNQMRYDVVIFVLSVISIMIGFALTFKLVNTCCRKK